MQSFGALAASLPGAGGGGAASIAPAARGQIVQQLIEIVLGQSQQESEMVEQDLAGQLEAFQAQQQEAVGPVLQALMSALQGASVAGGAEGAVAPAEPESAESLRAAY